MHSTSSLSDFWFISIYLQDSSKSYYNIIRSILQEVETHLYYLSNQTSEYLRSYTLPIRYDLSIWMLSAVREYLWACLFAARTAVSEANGFYAAPRYSPTSSLLSTKHFLSSLSVSCFLFQDWTKGVVAHRKKLFVVVRLAVDQLYFHF